QNIEKVVSEAISARAAQLGVDRSQLAIEIIEPIGNPKLQQVLTCRAQTTNFSQPSVALNNPYRSGMGDADLDSLVPVDIGVWDTHVDDSHCMFQSDNGTPVFFPTYVERDSNDPAEPTPPDRTTSCGTSRPPAYHFRPRYDHGTAVAGIFVAKG